MSKKRIAIVLMNLGGPDSLKAVRPFLQNLFSDPDIFKIPFFQKRLAWLIATLRSPKVKKSYAQIGGCSPIGVYTEIQKNLLQEHLNKIADGETEFTVLVAMRYWKPFTCETVLQLKGDRYDEVILLPLYPHYSIVTTGSSLNEWKRERVRQDYLATKTVYLESYHTHPLYLKAMNDRIESGLAKLPTEVRENTYLLFSAHSTPESIIKNGDPYQEQIIASVNEIMKYRNNDFRYGISYQSKVGPVKWLEPSTEETLKELSEEGYSSIFVIPISFVSDHIETLFELNIEYRVVADKSKIQYYSVMEGLNESPLFINLLADLINDKSKHLELDGF